MTRLYAQPYDITATGFSFDDAEDYARKAQALRNEYGQPVEEFEIQFIDGEWSLSQCNLSQFLEAALDWSEDQKLHFIVAVGECGYGGPIQL